MASYRHQHIERTASGVKGGMCKSNISRQSPCDSDNSGGHYLWPYRPICDLLLPNAFSCSDPLCIGLSCLGRVRVVGRVGSGVRGGGGEGGWQ